MKIGIIIGINNGIKSKKTFSYFCINSFLDLFNKHPQSNNFYYINKYKRNVNNFTNILNFNLRDDITLSELRNKIILFQQKHKLDKLIVYQDDFTNVININSIDKVINRYYNKQINFNILRIKLHLFYFIYVLTKQLNVPIIHIVEDPMEVDYRSLNKNNKQFCFYSSDRFELTTLFELSRFEVFNNNKQFMFSFGFTNMNKRNIFRENICKFFDKNLNNFEYKFNIFYKSAKNINNFTNLQKCKYIGYDQYLQYISKSYYTFVIPSYNENEFSLLRLLESILNKCIPIIVYNANIDKFFIDKEDLLYQLKKHNLIYNNIEDAFNAIKSLNYNIIINDLINCQTIKKIFLNLHNTDKINKEINRIINLE